MDQKQTPATVKPRRSPVLTLAVVVVVLAALAGALYVVARNLRKVALIASSVDTTAVVRPIPPDTGLARFRTSIQTKARTLAARCRMARKRFGAKLTAVQDSLGRECDSAIAALLAHVAALDSVKREDRKSAADSIRSDYSRAKAKVNAFTRSGGGGALVSDDSLDEELKKLISE